MSLVSERSRIEKGESESEIDVYLRYSLCVDRLIDQ